MVSVTFDPGAAICSISCIELVAGVYHLQLGLLQQLVQESKVEVACSGSAGWVQDQKLSLVLQRLSKVLHC